MRLNISLVTRCKIRSLIAAEVARCKKSLVTRCKFARFSLLVVKSLVTRCEIRLLLVAEVARCKKYSLLVAKFAQYLFQKLLVPKNCSLLVAKIAC